MTEDDALQQLDQLLATQGKSLGYPKRDIFLGAWRGLSYAEMIRDWDQEYDHGYIKAQGADLCKLLSRVLGIKVTKPTFQKAVTTGLAQVGQVRADDRQSSPNPTARLIHAPQLDSQEIRWVERGGIVTDLVEQLQQDCRLLFIVGLTGIGKTALATRLFVDDTLSQQLSNQVTIVLDHASNNFCNLARKLLDDRYLEDETIRQQPEQILAQLLQHLVEQPTLVVLDMLEEVLESDGHNRQQFTESLLETLLVKMLKAEDMPSRFILTSQERPPVLAEGRYERHCQIRELFGLTLDEALELFEQWGIVATSEDENTILRKIIRVYEGHPLALRVIAGEIGADYHGNISDYWQDYQRELSDDQLSDDHPFLSLDCYSLPLAEKVQTRIEQTFDRLRQAEPLACRLLCMASKMRIPTKREAWLSLISNYPHEEAVWAFQTLRRRFLIEVEPNSTQRRYRLHSLICRVAYAHLQQFTLEDSYDRSSSAYPGKSHSRHSHQPQLSHPGAAG